MSHFKLILNLTICLSATCILNGQDWLPKSRITHFGNSIEENITGAFHFRQDSSNRIIIEGYHGTAVYDGSSFIVDEQSPFQKRKLIDTDGDHWYGGPYSQLVLKKADGTTDSTSIQPYIDRNINSIHQDGDQFFIVTNEGILIAKKSIDGVEILKTIRTDGIDTWSVRTVQDTLYLKGIYNNQYYIAPYKDKPVTYRTNEKWRIDNGIFNLADGRIIMPTSNGDTILTKDSYIHQYLTSIDVDNVYFSLIDSKGKLWIVMNNHLGKKGIYLLNQQQPNDLQYVDIGIDSASLSVRALYEDHLGHMWAGTHEHGVCVIYDHPIQILDQKNGLNGKNVWSIYQTKNGDINLLMGCAGINTIKSDRTVELTNDEGCDWTMLEDSKGQIWRTPILSVYDKKGHLLKTYPNSYTEPNHIHVPIVYSLIEDGNGDIWAGTQQAIHRVRGESIDKYIIPDLDLSDYVFDIIEYKPDHLIFATSLGHLYTFHNGQFTRIDVNGHPSEIFMDSDSMIWISTLHNGIFSWDGDNITSYAHIAGLPMTISMMREDDTGHFWGIVDDKNEVFALRKADLLNGKESIQPMYYNISHGLPLINSNIFAQHTSARLKDGKMVFGNIYGGIVIDPKIINDTAPHFNIVVEHDDEPLSGDVIQLPLRKNYTTLYPSAINIHPGFPVELEYRINDEWQPVIDESITLNNIKAGKTKIAIRGRYANHNWQTPITYIINRPALLYEKPWFCVLLILLSLLGIYAFVKWRIKYVVDQNEKLEQRIQEQVQVIEEDKKNIEAALSEQKKLTTELKLATASKNRMYARIAHEFKSPLQSVKSILSKSTTADEIKNEDKLRALNNVDNLLKTSNEIMEMSKAKDGKLRAEKNWYNIYGIIRDQIELITSLSNDKDISIHFDEPQEPTYVNIDIFLISQVITNLLSNAIKYSPVGSQIHISSSIQNKQIIIAIKDQGYGISPEEIDLVASPYYRSESAMGEGTGIGLSLADEILKLHDSYIRISSKLDQGSTFSFALELPSQDTRELIDSLKSDQIIGTLPKDILNPSKKIILAVDDSDGILRFIVRSFINEYYVVTAQNGQDGLHQLEKIKPDLIVSDINMPFMDGISFLREVRSISKYKTVPFLFLTGSRAEEIEVLGLKSGADQILQKPIKTGYLISQVTQILSRKHDVENKATSTMADKILPTNVRTDDILLIEQLEKVILDNISDAELKSTDIANTMQMGEKTLRNRIKKITGLTIKEYLRNYRLEHAKILLESKHGNIGEIANATGFKTSSYFSKCFKLYFNVNPSDYK